MDRNKLRAAAAFVACEKDEISEITQINNRTDEFVKQDKVEILSFDNEQDFFNPHCAL